MTIVTAMHFKANTTMNSVLRIALQLFRDVFLNYFSITKYFGPSLLRANPWRLDCMKKQCSSINSNYWGETGILAHAGFLVIRMYQV